MSDRSFSLGIVESAFTAIWNYPKSFKIKAHGDNVYQFFFAKETDLIRLERGSPWLIKQFTIHVRRWKSGINFHEAARKIGERIGTVLEVDLFEMRPKELQIMKVRVNVDITTLKQSIRVASPAKQQYEIQLKYEKLGIRCRCCGFMGHEMRNYDTYLTLSASNVDPLLAWRADLKADQN
ncbi:hypothetical protein PIB30_002938 [Stylosanthes scabra]|uniref:DUF4283 domain-containing protein n=1 Tax=Stylosanthes scabra TaxID=79078 RepID=A0ABU6V546_9FABA|nr:hypothetical protein [Stylosanthes scabra]